MSDRLRDEVWIPALRWAARLWAAALVLFWGAFYVEHLVEWFGGGLVVPPAGVVALHTLHGLFLGGLLIGWRWELAGALLSLVAGVAFFMQAAGANGALYSLVGAVPAIIWIGLSVREWRRPPPDALYGA